MAFIRDVQQAHLEEILRGTSKEEVKFCSRVGIHKLYILSTSAEFTLKTHFFFKVHTRHCIT